MSEVTIQQLHTELFLTTKMKGLFVFVLFIALGISLGQCAILPNLRVYSSNQDTFYVGAVITADASLSCSSLGEDIWYRFDFGQGVFGIPTPNSKEEHIFTQPGDYRITVLLNDNNSSSSNTTLTGLAAPFVSTTVTIFPEKSCYKFCVRKDSGTFSTSLPMIFSTGKEYSLDISICDFTTETPTIAKSFASIGETPKIYSSDWDILEISVDPVWIDSANVWRAKVKATSPVGGASTIVSVSGTGITRELCRIGKSTFAVSTCGPGNTRYGSDSALIGKIVDVTNYTWVEELVFKPHACSSNTGWMLLKHNNGSDGLGSMFLFTDSALDPAGNEVRDLELGVVYDFVLLRRDAIFLTGNGLVRVLHNTTGTGVFSQIITGHDAIDNPNPNKPLPSILSASACPFTSTDPDFVFFGLNNQSSLPIGYDSILVSRTDNHDDWNSIESPYLGSRFLGAVRCEDRKMNVYLISNNSIGSNCSLVGHTDEGQYIHGFRFPTGSVLRGLTQHYTGGCHLIVYGDELWTGSAGIARMVRTAIPEYSSEGFTSVISSGRNGLYAGLTNHYRIFYGRINVGYAVSMSGSGCSPLFAATFDSIGKIHVLSGGRNSSTNLTHSVLPVQSLFQNGNLFTLSNTSLVPHFLSSSSVRFKVIGNVPTVVHGMNLRVGSETYSITNTDSEFFDVVRSPNVTEIGMDAIGIAENDVSYRWSVGSIQLSGVTKKSEIVVLIESGNVVLVSNSNETDWNSCHIGQTVEMGGPGSGSVLITSVTNSSVATGILMHSGWATSTTKEIVLRNWRLFDYREHENIACTNAKITISSSNPTGLSLVSLSSTQDFEFNDSLVGYIISNGRIESVLNASHAQASGFTETLPVGTFGIGEWGLVPPGDSSLHQLRERKWSFLSSNCTCSSIYNSIDSSGTIRNSKQYSIDIQKSLPLYTFSSPVSCSVLSYQSHPEIATAIVNDTVLTWRNTPSRRMDMNISNVLRNSNGQQSSIFTCSSRAGLTSCGDFDQFTSQKLRLGCPPTKRLKMSWRFTENEFLYGEPLFSDGEGMLENIPVNYRPPSSLGIAIPITDRFYNANPSQPKYRNVYRISQRTGSYHECAGKTECDCDASQRVSMRFQDSECLIRAPRAAFNAGGYLPSFSLVEEKGEGVDRRTVVLATDLKYTLSELNRRTDWCVNATGASCTTLNLTLTESTYMNTANYDGISFRGSELYHFRITVNDETDCSLKEEFVIWVFEAPFDETVVYSVVGIVAVVLALGLLVIYFHYSRVNQA